MKQRSLGSVVAAVRGIVASAFSTGTPIGVTLTAGHRLRNGERLAIAGETQMGTFGEWSISGVAAATVTLDGSSSTVASSGTPVVALLCDRTPYLPGNSAVVCVSSIGGAAATDGIATILIEKADGQTVGGFTYTNSSGVVTAGFADALLSGEIALPAFNDFGAMMVEVKLGRYMTMRASAWTSGSFGASLLA